MSLRFSSLRTFLLALAIWATPPLLADSAPSLPYPTNAALVYWRAFAALPVPTEEENTLFRMIGKEARTASADRKAITAFLEKFDITLATVDRALPLAKCDWELDYRQGPGISAPHLNKALLTIKALALRARFRVIEGEQFAAIKDLCKGLKISRHIFQSDQLLLTNLMQISMESIVIQAAAADWSQYDKTSLETLLATLDTLPERITTSRSFAEEGQLSISWLRNQFQASGEYSSATGGQRQPPGGPAFSKMDPKDFKQAIDALEQDYAQMTKLALLPFPESATKIEAFLEEVLNRKEAASFSALVLPAFSKVISKEMQQEMKLAMLRTAIAIRLHGPEALTTIKDPLTGEPFEYKALDHGFELTSREEIDEKPISIIFR